MRKLMLLRFVRSLAWCAIFGSLSAILLSCVVEPGQSARATSWRPPLWHKLVPPRPPRLDVQQKINALSGSLDELKRQLQQQQQEHQ